MDVGGEALKKNNAVAARVDPPPPATLGSIADRFGDKGRRGGRVPRVRSISALLQKERERERASATLLSHTRDGTRAILAASERVSSCTLDPGATTLSDV